MGRQGQICCTTEMGTGKEPDSQGASDSWTSRSLEFSQPADMVPVGMGKGGGHRQAGKLPYHWGQGATPNPVSMSKARSRPSRR